MTTECSTDRLGFHPLGRREVVGAFDGGTITSDATSRYKKIPADTIRLKLLKIGAQIRVTVRKIWVALAEGCPYEAVFRQVYQNLLATRPTRQGGERTSRGFRWGRRGRDRCARGR